MAIHLWKMDLNLSRTDRQSPYAHRLSDKGISGKDAQFMLDEVGITVNKNGIPFDKEKPNNYKAALNRHSCCNSKRNERSRYERNC